MRLSNLNESLTPIVEAAWPLDDMEAIFMNSKVKQWLADRGFTYGEMKTTPIEIHRDSHGRTFMGDSKTVCRVTTNKQEKNASIRAKQAKHKGIIRIL